MKNRTGNKESCIPINKGQFTLETPERQVEFERKRGFGVEDSYRENRRQWHAFPKQHYVADYPLHVDIELSSLCNLQCPMCYTITEEFKKRVNARLMECDLFKKIVEECVAGGVYSIRLSFRGESFLHPRILDCIEYAKKLGIKEVSTLTNGLKLDEVLFKQVMEAGMDWITISFDGLGEVYEKIRYPAKYLRAVEKIANYSKIKREAGNIKPVIKVQSILPAIQEDPKAFYDVFSPITDMVSANPLIDNMQDKAYLPKIKNFSCSQIYQRLVVGADGNCMMCSNDENNEIIVGNAYSESIYDIWHGNEMRRIRDVHKNYLGCEELPPCRRCYLPLETFDEIIHVDGRQVVAQKYVSGVQKVSELKTPDRYKRKGLHI